MAEQDAPCGELHILRGVGLEIFIINIYLNSARLYLRHNNRWIKRQKEAKTFFNTQYFR